VQRRLATLDRPALFKAAAHRGNWPRSPPSRLHRAELTRCANPRAGALRHLPAAKSSTPRERARIVAYDADQPRPRRRRQSVLDRPDARRHGPRLALYNDTAAPTQPVAIHRQPASLPRRPKAAMTPGRPSPISSCCRSNRTPPGGVCWFPAEKPDAWPVHRAPLSLSDRRSPALDPRQRARHQPARQLLQRQKSIATLGRPTTLPVTGPAAPAAAKSWVSK